MANNEVSYRYIHHNKCSGGRATREVDGKDYCLGLLDMAYEYKFCDECLECPRFINNNIDRIAELKGENK